MPTMTDTPSVLFNGLAEEAKRVFMSYTLVEENGERWPLNLEDAAYYAARAKIDTIDEARVMLVEMIRAALVAPKRRIATKPTLGSQRRRLAAKAGRGEVKALRGRVEDEE